MSYYVTMIPYFQMFWFRDKRLCAHDRFWMRNRHGFHVHSASNYSPITAVFSLISVFIKTPQVSLDAAEFFHVVFKIAPWLQRIDMSILDAVSVWKPRQKLT